MSNEMGPNFTEYFKHLTSELLFMDNEMLQLPFAEFKREKLKSILDDSAYFIMLETDRVNNSIQALHGSNDISQTDLQKCSVVLQAELDKMERGLEEILSIIFSKCRAMSSAEKEQLGRLIKKLPEKALDHIVKTIQHDNLSEPEPSQVFVDLDRQDDVTLWRLYYYVHTVLKVNKLSNTSPMPLPLM